ncbi:MULTISPECIES: low molecular weight protein-tyrosine-phosphatase [unclassified Pseudoalteromonas]|uniref:low molecular weight protein-tyrosine-phosphatase n=1 Tax=unclassified Pseudoalteromonas TaxID=194690 RepID=UPI0030151407
MSQINAILVVCMGNICRSPTMEAILKKRLAEAGLDVRVESAGTISYHQGNPPDPRSVAAGTARGYDFSAMQAQPVKPSDFAEFDLVLCADNANYQDLVAQCPAHYQHKIQMFLDYGEAAQAEVPDPYYGGENGFELVLDLIEDACDVIIDKIRLSTR